MQAWQAKMFERYGAAYLLAASALNLSGMLLVVVPATAALAGHYEGLTLGEYFVLVGVTDACAIVTVAATFFVVRRPLSATFTWSRTRDHALEPAARAFVFDGPRTLAFGGLTGANLALGPIAALLLTPRGHTTALDWLEVLLGTEAGLVFAMFNTWFSLDVIVQPIRAALGGPPANARPTSLTVRLALVIPAAIIVAAIAVGTLTTTRAHAGAGHLLLIYGIAAACFVFNAAVVAPLFASGVIGPFASLARVTREIGAGRFNARVSVAATDELGRLGQSFNQMLEELEASRERIVTASDAGRRKVERDLHDGAQQRLVLLRLKLNTLARQLGPHPLIDELAGDVEAALAELRDLAHGLYPQLLESDGLGAALREAATRTAIPTTVETDVTVRYPHEVEAAVYFCCLEALQNAGKHAGPGASARVSLTLQDGQLGFTISDTGAGFDPASANGSSGLQNMADRIGALGGELRIESAPGRGTRIAGAVPSTTES